MTSSGSLLLWVSIQSGGGAVHHWHVLDSRLAWYILWAHWPPIAEFQCEGRNISFQSWHVPQICEVQDPWNPKKIIGCVAFNAPGLACFGPGHMIYTRETTAIPGIWTDCPVFCRAWTAWDDLRLFPFGSKKRVKCAEPGSSQRSVARGIKFLNPLKLITHISRERQSWGEFVVHSWIYCCHMAPLFQE